MTLNSNSTDSKVNSLEDCIRSALELGELSPVVEAQIKYLTATSLLSERDYALLQLLADAIADGCIRRGER